MEACGNGAAGVPLEKPIKREVFGNVFGLAFLMQGSQQLDGDDLRPIHGGR
jgi:hypothetical protein